MTSEKYFDEDDFMITPCKVDNELFDEESNIIHKLLNVKRVPLPKDGEDWEILENNQVVFVVKGVKLNKKQKTFLRSIDGILALMSLYKEGSINMNKVKSKINSMI